MISVQHQRSKEARTFCEAPSRRVAALAMPVRPSGARRAAQQQRLRCERARMMVAAGAASADTDRHDNAGVPDVDHTHAQPTASPQPGTKGARAGDFFSPLWPHAAPTHYAQLLTRVTSPPLRVCCVCRRRLSCSYLSGDATRRHPAHDMTTCMACAGRRSDTACRATMAHVPSTLNRLGLLPALSAFVCCVRASVSRTIACSCGRWHVASGVSALDIA